MNKYTEQQKTDYYSTISGLFEPYFWAMMAAQALEGCVANSLQIEALDALTLAEGERLLKDIPSTLGKRVYALKEIDAAVSKLFPKLKPLIKKRNYLAHSFLCEAHGRISETPSTVATLVNELDEARTAFHEGARQVQGANLDRLLVKMKLTPEQVSDYGQLKEITLPI